MLARESPKASAAIASRLCAELYDLDVIKEGIEDGSSNSTRFLLLSRGTYPNKGDKTSIIFAVPHEAGKLYDVLRLFAEADINLTRIASMPLRSDPGNYSFFLDFEGTQQDDRIAGVLGKMEKLAIGLKLLGSYPADTSSA
jgi:prephenate dehydratase